MSLADELVNEILVRLPAKSLMRFKSVERSWNTLFKTNSFIRRQKERQMESTYDDRFILFYEEREGIDLIPRITLLSTCDPPVYETLEYPISYPNHFVLDVSACCHFNGIYCLDPTFNPNFADDDSYIRERIFWNPTTREVKVFPPDPRARTVSSFAFSYHCGLGASDPDTFDNIKFIEIYIMNTTVVYAQLYDLNTDSWFDILDIRDSYADVCDVKVAIGGSGAYSNGVYHWLSADYTCIICFDFRSNKFRTIKTPSTMDSGQIIEANNCIAYIAYSYDVADDSTHNWAEIWNLKHDGSWVKLCNIALPQGCTTICAILKDGTEFLGEPAYDYMSLFNSQQLMREFYIPAAYGSDFDFYRYVETIAPLTL